MLRTEKKPADVEAKDQEEDDALDYHYMEQDLERRREDVARRKSEKAAAVEAKRKAIADAEAAKAAAKLEKLEKLSAKEKHHRKSKKHSKAAHAERTKRKHLKEDAAEDLEEQDEVEASPPGKSVPPRPTRKEEDDSDSDDAVDDDSTASEGSDDTDDSQSREDGDSDARESEEDSESTVSDDSGEKKAEDDNGEGGDSEADDDSDVQADEDSLVETSSKRRQAPVAPHGPTQLYADGDWDADSQLVEMGEATKELRNAMHFLPALGINDPNDIAYRAMDMIMGIASIIPEDYPYVCICGDTGVCVENIPPASATDCSMRIGQKSRAARTTSTGLTIGLLLSALVGSIYH